jgi:4-amino-4-deoxy-L-arabinose transferase-like glycosyltransferase
MKIIRHQICVALLAGLLAFLNLGGAGLFDEDEPKNAACAREMLARGDWIVPTFNRDLRTDKPILLYWLMLIAYHALGVSEFSARVASAALAVCTALVVYHLGRRLYSARVGLWASTILSTSLMYDVVARAATPDSTFIFFCTLALLCYVLAAPAWQTALDPRQPLCWRAYVPPSWQRWAPCYAAMGLAALAKGPAGLVLPLGAIGFFLLMSRTPPPAGLHLMPWPEALKRISSWLRAAFGLASILEVARAMQPRTAIPVVGAVVLPWYLAVGIATKGAWLAGFLGKHNVGRFAAAMEGHRGPIFYYGIAILIGFFPWSVFLGSALPRWWTRLKLTNAPASDRFLGCWAAFYVGLFSLAGTKLPNYVLPAYPALALVTAALLVDWLGQPRLVGGRQLRLAFATVAVVGAALLVGLPIASIFLLPGEWLLGSIGLAALAGGLLALHCLQRQRLKSALWTFSAMAVIQSLVIFAFAAHRLSAHQTSKTFADFAQRDAQGSATLAVYEYFEPSLVFYADQRVNRFEKVREVRQFFESAPRPYLITDQRAMRHLAPALPSDVHVMLRKRRFLRRTDLVLLGRLGQVARRPNAVPR